MQHPISRKLEQWYKSHKRSLPWRDNPEPYKVWLSEIILQQTRVQQGLPYYLRFVEQFPNVQALALAPLDQVLKLWQGLGYYSRARNLHRCAQIIMEKHDGHFPKTYKEWIQLPGIGPYTAGAICSICFNEAVAAIDGNVNRVVSRLFEIKHPQESPLFKQQILEASKLLMQDVVPNIFNQALMEFGALQCIPKSPNCSQCPLRTHCLALKSNIVAEIPQKKTKVKVRDRFFYYFILKDAMTVYVEQRESKDIWNKLFQFPLIETKEEVAAVEAMRLFNEKHQVESKPSHIFPPNKVHKLSHQRLHIQFIELELKHDFKDNTYQKLSISETKTKAFPKPISDFIEKNL